ncbi:hypothetical protein ACS0TY_026703 [Phlomoides rotata]
MHGKCYSRVWNSIRHTSSLMYRVNTSTLGTQRSPPGDRQQVVQVWSTRLDSYHCTMFPRNLGITRLGW